MALPKPQLDHIIIHIPYSLVQTPPPWLASAFTIAPGGRHGDGKTENKLVVFADGTYLELIAFTSEEAKEGHWWGQKGYGIIDYAFTLEGGANAYKELQQSWEKLELPAGWKPGPLQYGSRTRPDGVKIEWQVAFPDRGVRGEAPFWCFDVTPREKRVPSDEHLIEHPCGAKGVADLLLFPNEPQRGSLKKLLDGMIPSSGDERPDEYTWDLATPRKIESSVPCALSLMQKKDSYVQQALKRRKLVARLTLLTDGRDEQIETRNIRETVNGDEVSIGFVTA